VILLVVIVFFRRGFVGELSALATYLANRRRRPDAKAETGKPASAH
jgi:hypothetical protein